MADERVSGGDVVVVLDDNGDVYGVFSSITNAQETLTFLDDAGRVKIQTFEVDYRWKHRRRIARRIGSEKVSAGS